MPATRIFPLLVVLILSSMQYAPSQETNMPDVPTPPMPIAAC